MNEIIASSVGPIIGGLITLILWFLAYNYIYKRQLKHERLLNLSPIVQVELSLKDIKTAFKFHGITDVDIENAEVTHEELAYLVANFTAGRIYDVGTYSMEDRYDERNYRYKMLAQPSTRKAWPLIVRMMTADDYILKLERTLVHIMNVETHTD